MVFESKDDISTRSVKLLYPLFIGQFFGFILTAATFIVVTRLLGPREYGIYIFAFGFCGLVNAFAAFGMGAYFNRQLAKLEYNRDGKGILRELASGYTILIVIGALLSIFGILISSYVASMFPNVMVQPATLMLASGLILFLMIDTAAVSALIGLGRADLASIANVMIDVVQLVLSVVLTIAYGVNGAVGAMLIGYIFGVVVTSYFIYVAVSKYVKFRICIPSKQELKKVLTFTTPLAANNFLNTGMQNFSVLLLGWFVAATVLGNYGAANKGLAMLAMVYGALGSGLLTIFTNASSMKKSGEVNTTYNKIIKLSLMLTLPMIMFVAVMAAPGLSLLVSPSYTTASPFLTLIALGTMIGIFGAFISYLLISGSHTKSVLITNLVSAIAQFVLLIVLVPYLARGFGAVLAVYGAIVAIYFVGNLIEDIMFALQTEKKFRLVIQYRKIALIYLSNIALGLLLAVWLFASNSYMQSMTTTGRCLLQIAVGMIISVALYPPILALFKAVSPRDISIMKTTVKKLGVVGRFASVLFVYFEYVYMKLAVA